MSDFKAASLTLNGATAAHDNNLVTAVTRPRDGFDRLVVNPDTVPTASDQLRAFDRCMDGQRVLASLLVVQVS